MIDGNMVDTDVNVFSSLDVADAEAHPDRTDPTDRADPVVRVDRVLGFPRRRLDLARAALAKSHATLVRAAARSGQQAPQAAEIVVLRERVESRCTECGVICEGMVGGRCVACRDGYLVMREVVDLEIRGPRPVLAGWTFLAVVEPLAGGNLIRQVPGADVRDGELLPWRQSDLRCDHCGTRRNRAETFVVRADGSDPAIGAGTHRQIGRSCLVKFLGGRSAAEIVSSLGWQELVRAAGDDGEGGWGRDQTCWDPTEYLTWCVAVARVHGFVSKKRAQEGSGQRATAGVVDYLLTPQRGAREVAAWRAARAECAPTDADGARAALVLAWARDLPGASDYDRNLTLVARQSTLDPRHAGILASAVSGYDRAVGDVVRRSAVAVDPATIRSQHVGQVGDKLQVEVVVERCSSHATNFGTRHVIVMRDLQGNMLVWKTESRTAAVGARLEVRGQIKAHGEFRGEPQTELLRCRVREIEVKASGVDASD